MSLCEYCGLYEAPDDSDYCLSCQELMRQAFALLFAGLTDLFAAHREQEAAEKESRHGNPFLKRVA
jgi:hypothetical protein